tara:strand:+ start:1682 stop:2092 length:411 start_codon:yes stop_codon:yes gene_type:complete
VWGVTYTLNFKNATGKIMSINLGEYLKGEADPHGTDAHAPGAKLDAGKPRVGLMLSGFARALLAVSEITTHGALKYSENGWMEVPDAPKRYDDAKGRHMLQGYIEERDPDTGLDHLAQEAWNALALLELKLRERGG